MLTQLRPSCWMLRSVTGAANPSCPSQQIPQRQTTPGSSEGCGATWCSVGNNRCCSDWWLAYCLCLAAACLTLPLPHLELTQCLSAWFTLPLPLSLVHSTSASQHGSLYLCLSAWFTSASQPDSLIGLTAWFTYWPHSLVHPPAVAAEAVAGLRGSGVASSG
jgi:hypothetical protein